MTHKTIVLPYIDCSIIVLEKVGYGRNNIDCSIIVLKIPWLTTSLHFPLHFFYPTLFQTNQIANGNVGMALYFENATTQSETSLCWGYHGSSTLPLIRQNIFLHINFDGTSLVASVLIEDFALEDQK